MYSFKEICVEVNLQNKWLYCRGCLLRCWIENFTLDIDRNLCLAIAYEGFLTSNKIKVCKLRDLWPLTQTSHEIHKIRLKLPNRAIGHLKKVKGHKPNFSRFYSSSCYLSSRNMTVTCVFRLFQAISIIWNNQHVDRLGALWLLKSYFCIRIFGMMIMQEIDQDIWKDTCRVISLFSTWLRLHWRFYRKPVKNWCLTLLHCKKF